MVDVIAWPPVAATGYENTVSQPVSRSTSVLTGRRYVSSALRSRRVGKVLVSGIGWDGASAGYVEMLKRQLRGGVNLVRMSLLAPIWYHAASDLEYLRGERELEWMAGIHRMGWRSGPGDMSWVVGLPISGVAGTLGDWPTLTCSDLPASQIVAWPSEVVRVTDSNGLIHTARVLRLARSNENGEAVLVLDSALPDGKALIGFYESTVFEVLDPNDVRAVQPAGADWSYTFNLREVFEDETDGFVEVNPWR